MTKSLELQREIMLQLPEEVFERFKASYTVVQELHVYCTALVQQRWASVLSDKTQETEGKKSFFLSWERCAGRHH